MGRCLFGATGARRLCPKSTTTPVAARVDIVGVHWVHPSQSIELLTIVVEDAAWVFRSLNTGDRAQIFINGLEFMIGHIAERRPRHDLEETAIEGSRQASSVRSARAGRMNVIEVSAIPDDLNKFGKRVAAFRLPSFIRRQITRDNVRKRTRTWESAEIHATAQIGVRIDLGRLTKVRIPTGGKFGGGVVRVAPVAIGLRVDNETAKSH